LGFLNFKTKLYYNGLSWEEILEDAQQAKNDRFEKMGYTSSNFLYSQFDVISLIIILIILGIFLKYLIWATKKLYKFKCMRIIGMFLPGTNLFRRILWRVYLILFVQLFLSALVELDKSKFDEVLPSNLRQMLLTTRYSLQTGIKRQESWLCSYY
jgi:hypothetical protein